MKKEFLKFLLLFAVAIGAGPASSAFYSWSRTASTDATADATINWSEGMSPSSVNDSARAMMARLAEYRDDTSGVLVAGGSATAYTVTTFQGLTTEPPDGQLLAIRVGVTNGASPTLTADGGNAYPIQAVAGTGLPAGTLVALTPYTLMYDHNGGGRWLLRDAQSSYGIPLGGYLLSSAPTAPNSNFMIPQGQCISRTTYAGYFALVGTAYGVCDGSTTFGLPNPGGRALVMLDYNGLLPSVCGGGSTMTNLSNGPNGVCGSATTALTTPNMAPYTPTGTVTGSFSGSGTASVPFVATGLGFQTAGSGGTATGGGPTSASVSVSGSITAAFSGAAQGGSSAPFSQMQPSYAVQVFVRVL